MTLTLLLCSLLLTCYISSFQLVFLQLLPTYLGCHGDWPQAVRPDVVEATGISYTSKGLEKKCPSRCEHSKQSGESGKEMCEKEVANLIWKSH